MVVGAELCSIYPRLNGRFERAAVPLFCPNPSTAFQSELFRPSALAEQATKLSSFSCCTGSMWGVTLFFLW